MKYKFMGQLAAHMYSHYYEWCLPGHISGIYWSSFHDIRD